MGALPHVQPSSTPKKPASRARNPIKAERCQTRTLPEIQAEFRSRTDYTKGTGYVPSYHAMLEDLVRLSSGRVCDWIVFFSLQNCSLRIPKGGTPAQMPAEAEMSVTELALRIGCEERSVNRELEYLKTRGMAAIVRLADSRFLITLLFQDWDEIELSYADWRAKQEKPAAAVDDDETADDETALEVRKGRVELTPAPVAVRPGKESRKVPVKCGVRSIRVHWESKVLALQFSAVVDSGDLVITGNVPDAGANSKVHANRANSTTSGQTSGHTGPHNGKIPPNAGNGRNGDVKAKVTHKRAAELAQIFDPFCLQGCGRSLSNDGRFLQQACEFIGDTPHDYVVCSVNLRAQRRIEPGHVPQICKQIAADFKAGTKAPTGGRFAGAISPKTRAFNEMYKAFNAAKERGKR